MLLVTGGSGFIGRAICERAVGDGREVTSVSRGGRPAAEARWVDRVEWVEADLLDPAAWRSALVDATTVVHSIGILHESPPEASFERLNGDAGIVAGLEAERAGAERFVHLSAGVQPPRARSAYLESKRRAERTLGGLDLDLVILRPGPVYGPDQPHFSAPANALFGAIDRLGPLAAALGTARPLSVDAVADAALAAVDGELEGTVEVPELANYR